MADNFKNPFFERRTYIFILCFALYTFILDGYYERRCNRASAKLRVLPDFSTGSSGKLLITKDKAAIEQLASPDPLIRTITGQTRFVTRTVFKQVLVPITDTMKLMVTDSIRSLALPARLYRSDSAITITAKIDTNGLMIDSLSIKDRVTVNIGWKKQKWYKVWKREPIVSVRHSNPYVTSDSVFSVLYQPSKPGVAAWLSAGILIGLLIP